jgi:hypothetical protein
VGNDAVADVIESRETKLGLVQWAIIGLLTVVATLAAFNARSYIEGIAADVYANQGLKPSEVRSKLVEMETKLENVEDNIGEVRDDLRVLINRL